MAEMNTHIAFCLTEWSHDQMALSLQTIHKNVGYHKVRFSLSSEIEHVLEHRKKEIFL